MNTTNVWDGSKTVSFSVTAACYDMSTIENVLIEKDYEVVEISAASLIISVPDSIDTILCVIENNHPSVSSHGGDIVFLIDSTNDDLNDDVVNNMRDILRIAKPYMGLKRGFDVHFFNTNFVDGTSESFRHNLDRYVGQFSGGERTKLA